MIADRITRLLQIGLLTASAVLFSPQASAQATRAAAPPASQPPVAVTPEQPDAERTAQNLRTLLERYPPTLRHTLALDPTLLSNQAYLAPYPALASFLAAHPEIARNPAFYLGQPDTFRPPRDPGLELWERLLEAMSIFAALGMAIALIIWLIRTLIDYRRWSRLASVQTNVHTKLLDRFTANEDLLAYIQSPAGSRFLQSAPISLDAGPRALSAPLGRILWSVQGGIVLLAAGIGFEVVSRRINETASQPMHALGVLAMALGVGFIVSAIVSFGISYRLGLLEAPQQPTRSELPTV